MPGPPFDDVEVKLQNAALAEDQFRDWHQRGLRAFAKEGAAGSEEQILHQLLRQGGASAGAAALHIFFSGEMDGVPIEAVVVVETRILRGDDSVLEIWRDSIQRYELVAVVIGLAVNRGLQAAFDVDCRGGRIDPAGEDQCERGQRPQQRQREAKPAQDRWKRDLPVRRPGLRFWLCVWRCRHDSELRGTGPPLTDCTCELA